MKTIFITLAAISALMLTGECESLLTLILWDAFWFTMLTLAIRRLEVIENDRA